MVPRLMESQWDSVTSRPNNKCYPIGGENHLGIFPVILLPGAEERCTYGIQWWNDIDLLLRLLRGSVFLWLLGLFCCGIMFGSLDVWNHFCPACMASFFHDYCLSHERVFSALFRTHNEMVRPQLNSSMKNLEVKREKEVLATCTQQEYLDI